MKAFVFTLDVLVALLLFLLMLTLVLTYFIEPELPRSLYLKQLSLDFLHVANRRDGFTDALNGNPVVLRNLFRDLPSGVCMQVRMVNSQNNETVVADPSCSGYGRELQTSWIPFYYNASVYRVQLESWYKR